MNHNIPSDKPIIYMGLANPQKGILEVYDALKHEDYTLLMTGPFNPEVDIPVKRLFLDRHDYLCLLKASTVVVSMPVIEEGWSRVAHESMLCGTPVIGSGTGGMKELLDGGRQMICNDFHNLSAVTKGVIEQREKYASDGYDYAKRFDLSYFQKEWHGFIQEVLANRLRQDMKHLKIAWLLWRSAGFNKTFILILRETFRRILSFETASIFQFDLTKHFEVPATPDSFSIRALQSGDVNSMLLLNEEETDMDELKIRLERIRLIESQIPICYVAADFK